MRTWLEKNPDHVGHEGKRQPNHAAIAVATSGRPYVAAAVDRHADLDTTSAVAEEIPVQLFLLLPDMFVSA